MDQRVSDFDDHRPDNGIFGLRTAIGTWHLTDPWPSSGSSCDIEASVSGSKIRTLKIIIWEYRAWMHVSVIL